MVGAGFGGLVTAIGLAERGWRVRVHERRASLQGEGYGIAIHRNMACIFAAFDVLDLVLKGGKRLDRRDSLDRHGNVVLSRKTARSTYRVDRQHVIAVLADRARRSGVETVFNSAVRHVTAGGDLAFEGGGTTKADLVVGADGVNSTVRDSLHLLDRRIWDRDGGVRVTIPRSAAEKARDVRDGVPLIEAWSDRRRIIACPVTDDDLYLLLTCTTGDVAARTTPIDVEAWAKSFPSLVDVLRRARDDGDWRQAHWDRFQTIRLKRWSAGRVALVGDAAHAMAPYLAQGAGHAMMNGLALAVAVEKMPDIPAALRMWEARERPLTEHTQRWTRFYGRTMLLPGLLKKIVIRAESLGWVAEHYQRAANHVPTGTMGLSGPF